MSTHKPKSLMAAVIFLGLTLGSFMSQARDIGFMCRAFYAHTTFVRPTVYSGVLVELADGTQSLAYVANSWGPGHQVALDKIKATHEATNPVVRGLWFGELALIEAPGHRPTLIAVNEVSGTYYESTINPQKALFPYHNDVNAMRNFLNRDGHWDVTQAKYRTYEENPAHLDWSAEYLKQKLNLSNTSHDINNVFQPVTMGTQMALMDPARFGHILKKALNANYLTTIEVLAREPKFNKLVIHRMLMLAKILMNQTEFTKEQLTEFKDLNRQFLAEWKEYSQSLADNIQIL